MLRSDRLRIRQAGSEAIRAIADSQLVNIQRRLDRGIGSSGRPFVPYAPSTARRKGRSAPVTLRESGNMRSKMYVRRIRLDTFEITFKDRGSERIARFQHGGTRRATAVDSRRRASVRRRGTRHIVRNTGGFHIPPRPFISPTAQEIAAADRLYGVTVDARFPGDLRRRIVISFRA